MKIFKDDLFDSKYKSFRPVPMNQPEFQYKLVKFCCKENQLKPIQMISLNDTDSLTMNFTGNFMFYIAPDQKHIILYRCSNLSVQKFKLNSDYRNVQNVTLIHNKIIFFTISKDQESITKRFVVFLYLKNAFDEASLICEIELNSEDDKLYLIPNQFVFVESNFDVDCSLDCDENLYQQK